MMAFVGLAQPRRSRTIHTCVDIKRYVVVQHTNFALSFRDLRGEGFWREDEYVILCHTDAEAERYSPRQNYGIARGR